MLRQPHFWISAELVFEDGQFRKSSLHGFEGQSPFQGKMIGMGAQPQTL